MIEILKWWSENPILGVILLVALVLALEAIFAPLARIRGTK